MEVYMAGQFLEKEEKECGDQQSRETGKIKEFSPLLTRKLKDEMEV